MGRNRLEIVAVAWAALLTGMILGQYLLKLSIKQARQRAVEQYR